MRLGLSRQPRAGEMSNSLSRRTLIGAAAYALATAAAALGAAAEEELSDADKIKQSDAHYQRQPKGQQRCEICLQFNPPNRCKIVQGTVDAKGWCQFFAARENAR